MPSEGENLKNKSGQTVAETRRAPVFRNTLADSHPVVRIAGLTGLICCALLLGLIATLERSAPPQTAPTDNHAKAVPEALGSSAQAGIVWPPEKAPALDFDQFYADSYAPAEVSLSFPVKRGDTLMDVLLRAGMERRQAHAAIGALSDKFDMRKLKSDQKVVVTWSEQPDGTRHFREVALSPDVTQRIAARLNGHGGFELSEQTFELARTDYLSSGTIENSLYLSARDEGVPNAVIVDLIRIFSFNVDFQREIRKGDGFELYYHRFHDSYDRPVKEGNIDYASLELRGEKLRLYRFTPPDTGRTEYFDENGKSARRMLMKTPIDGARLTSRFGLRHHPVLGYSRMHKGLDFGAASGTPIMAAGDGVIERSRTHGGYGRYVRIRHNGQYKTAYAHLSRYGPGIKEGRRVEQGQIIGYVGATGLATGPHLHYEVMSDDKQINPLTLKLPSGRQLDADILKQFKDTIRRYDERVASLRPQRVAQAGGCETHDSAQSSALC